MDVDIQIPRLAKGQKHRCNILMSTPEVLLNRHFYFDYLINY